MAVPPVECVALWAGNFNGAQALTFKSQLVVFINVIKLSDSVVYCFPLFGY